MLALTFLQHGNGNFKLNFHRDLREIESFFRGVSRRRRDLNVSPLTGAPSGAFRARAPAFLAAWSLSGRRGPHGAETRRL